MTQQTETWIILKPIAERFSRVSAEITDDEIRNIIKRAMKEKIANAINFEDVAYILQDWINENSEKIVEAMQEAISKRLELPNGYRW